VTWRIVYRAEAEQDIAAVAEWYEDRGESLVAEFLRAFDAAIASISRNPEQYPQVHPRVRRALLRRFPYSILYSLTEEDVVVLGCMHPAPVAASAIAYSVPNTALQWTISCHDFSRGSSLPSTADCH
jgi:plasmid stabilization system protein ParE